MALEEVAAILGSEQKYRLANGVKRYTLRDTGFGETKKGSFILERSLDPLSPYNQGFKLKVTIDAQLTKLSMSVTTANGLKAVNIYSKPDYAENIEQFDFLITDLIKRGVLETV